MQVSTVIEWEFIFSVLFKFALLALIVERALYQIFDTKLWQAFEDFWDQKTGNDYFDMKPWLSVVLCAVLVFYFDLDIVTALFSKTSDTEINFQLRSVFLTKIITSFFLAGGSTGVYKMFKNLRLMKKTKD